MIIEYKMHMTPGGMRVPEWIEDGGYYHDADNNTFVGWSPDEADREYYVPDTVTTLTQTELNTKVLALHAANKMSKLDTDGTRSDMTNAEVTAMVNAWCEARG